MGNKLLRGRLVAARMVLGVRAVAARMALGARANR